MSIENYFSIKCTIHNYFEGQKSSPIEFHNWPFSFLYSLVCPPLQARRRGPGEKRKSAEIFGNPIELKSVGNVLLYFDLSIIEIERGFVGITVYFYLFPQKCLGGREEYQDRRGGGREAAELCSGKAIEIWHQSRWRLTMNKTTSVNNNHFIICWL